MNSSQRRKIIRSKKVDNTRKYELIMGNCGRKLMQKCIMCAAAIHLPTLLYSNVEYGCPQEHWKEWLANVGEAQLTVLLDYPEGSPQWFCDDVKKEAECRMESFFVSIKGEKDEKA